MGSHRSLLLSPLSLIITTIAIIAASAAASSVIETVAGDPISGLSDGRSEDLFCDSWRLSVEANNAGRWAMVPARCAGFVEGYMNGELYASDLDVVSGESLAFAETVGVAGDGKDAWIFDIDETLLSNLPYYAVNGYGSKIFNETSFNDWVYLAKAPALPSSLKLYEELQGLGLQLILLTGRTEAQRNLTVENLLFAGYRSWERLILRGFSDMGKAAVVYKSEKRAELEGQGFRIHGNSGDQWSDLLGSPVAKRSFKLSNPMYYIQ